MTATDPGVPPPDHPRPPDPLPARPPDSWRSRPARQQPPWPDPVALRRTVAELEGAPPLLHPAECDRLRARLAAVARGEAFLLQGGDRTETFAGTTATQIRTKLRTLLQMAMILSYAGSVPVVKVGRMAGQYAAPCSAPTETRDGVTLPAFGGDAVNGPDFSPGARTPDPERLRRAYQASAAALNLLRALTAGDDTALRRIHEWNQDFVARSPAGERYERLVRDIDTAIRFMTACGARTDALRTADFYTSHEALLLEYESALTRVDERSGASYDLSGHLVWIGEGTRQPDGAHVEFASGVGNPLGVELGPTATADEVLALVDRLDPEREPGRLTFLTRMGAAAVRDRLPELVAKVTASGARVGWVCYPVHGPALGSPAGPTTDLCTRVLDEITGFFEVHRALGTHPGGVHLELTGDEVTERVRGPREAAQGAGPARHGTADGPRLDRAQALDLAFAIAELYRSQ
ncbi:3-deoxy-7-phosphoheptulonate synthase [Streptomyces sp. NPDC048638]|uniref:3-deoxy-7-phosphoheptulonate synthase n=1 Tax=Streptomyces sp. NPDC048638 TaxID=3365580 RepID=UPI00371DEAA8